VEVPPLLFIPFVENAFKHGDFSSPGEGMDLNCYVTKNKVNFSIRNKIKVSGSKDEDGGIGLQNVQKRLDLLYPNRHSLHISETGRFFHIQLAIPNE
jgi:two-component system, LytTR family, sensor kinase